MQDKKYLIEIPDMPEGSGVWDADKWERNKDVFMEDYPNAQVFELGEYDEEDSRESDQILLSFEDEASSGIWDQAKWERNKYAFTKDNPEAQVSRVRYVDYWGQKAEDNRAEKAALQQPDEERNARLAEIGYYDDLSEGQRVFDLNAPNMIGLKPLSSAIDTNSVSGQTTYLDPRVQEFFANDSAYTDKMAEIARLDAEYNRNPNVIAQREWEAQQLAEQKAYAANLEKEIRENLDTDVDVVKASRGGVAKRGYDPLESQQMSYLLDKIAGDEAGSGEQENEKLERYTTSLKLLEKAKIARNVAGKGFGGAVIDWAKEGFMDAGTQDDIEAYNEIGNILTRLEKQVGSLKEENLTEEVFNQYLSKDEQALIKSFFEYNKAMADAQQDMSQSYKGGKIFAESIPFMLEFLTTGGLYKGAGRAATRGLERALVNWVSKAARKTASRTARKIAAASARDLTYALAGTAARTLFTPGTYNRMAEESVKIEDGHLNRAKNAAVAAADMYVENLSEVSGGLIGKTFGWAGKGVGWLIGKTPLSKIGSVLADNKLMQSISAFMPKLEALGFHGLPEEIGEEFIGNAIREVMNIQPGALKEMVSDDNFGAMLIGFAPMTLIGAAGGAISLGVVNYEAAKLGNKMREMMSDHYSVEEIDAMMSSVQSAGTAEEIQQAIKPMAMAIARASESGMITQEQAAEELETLYQWGGFMAQNNALLFSKKAQDNELANAKRAEMVDQYGRFWQEDETESVQVATLNNGSTVFVTSAPAEDGKITTIDVATGKKGFANVSDIATEEVEGEQIQSSTTMTMSAFLNGQIAMGRKTAEETRMTNERNAQIEALRAEVTPGTRINLGTEGSPINVFAKKVGNNGITIVDETGMESILGWEQAADALGKPIIVETDQQKLDAEISARLQRLAERRMQRKVTPAVENATTEAAEESAEVTAQEQVHIPLNEDGTVNEAAFWTQDPEGYVKWNDEQNQDGGQDSLRQIAISKQELIGMLNEVAAGQNTSNPTMRKAAEKQVAAIAEKIARLEALEMSYADALAEEKEAVQQTAATPTATMNEEQLEQMDTQYQGILGKTRIQGERVRVMQEYLNKLAEGSVPVVLLTMQNYEERMKEDGVPNSLINAVKKQVDAGKTVAGFMAAGKVYLMHEGLTSIEDGRVTYVHERQHAFNRANPELVQRVADALGNEEAALAILKTFVNEKALETYKDDDLNALADEIICRSMEIVYSNEEFSVDLQSRGVPSEVISIITEIDNEQRQDQSLSYARRRGRRNSYSDVSGAGSVRQDGRDIEQISEGILEQEETRPSGSSGGGTQTGEGAEVNPEGPSFRIVEDPEEVNPAFVEAISTDVDEAEYAQFLDDKAFADPQPVDGIQPDDVRFSIVLEDKMRGNTQAYFDKHYNGGTLGKKDQKLVPLNVTHFTQVLLDAANAQIEEMRKYMLPYLDMESKGKRFLPAEVYGKSTLFDNSSYGKTMENTLICTRTLAYIDFVEEVKKRIGRPLTATESFLASQMLYDIAVDPQCLYCYVSLDRKAYDEFLLRYIQQRDEVISKWNASDKSAEAKDALYKEFLAGRKPTSQMQARFESWLLLSEGDNAITPADLATKARRGDLKISEAPEAWEKARNKYQKLKGDKKLAYAASEEYQTALWNYLASPLGQVTDAEAYAQSASWAKKEEDYRSYTGELLKCTADALKGLMGHYGLRFYSFSEYSPAFILENMQMVRDAAARGLKGFAYTKEIDFIKIFAPTGMNINCSVYGRVDSEGNVVPDIKQGADWAQVQALREQYPNVGAVFVATNDEMVEWALNQPWIDVIIPFHIVRTGADIAKFYEWTNYSSMQADTAPSGKTTYIFPHEHHNDKTTFLKIAQERGLSPRFADVKLADGRSIVEHPNYMRLVNETRRSVDETPILTPTFNVDAAKESFDAFVAKGGYYSGYFYEDEAFEQGIETVVEDIKAGKTAKDVDYGRQDVPIDVAKIMAKRAEMERKHGKSGVIDLVEEARKADLRHRVVAEGTLVPGHKKGQPMLSDAEMMADVSFRITKNTKATIEKWFNKAGIDDELTQSTINYLDSAFKDATEQLCAAKWYLGGKINLPGEDDYKVRDAVKVAKKNKVDALLYDSPMDIIYQFGKPNEKQKPINPDNVPTLKNRTEVPGTDIVIYDVEESEESRENMREIINTHYGKNASPWCLLQGNEFGQLTPEAKERWEYYNAYPKQVAFKGGRLLAFSANSAKNVAWWDRLDKPFEGVPVMEKLNDAQNRRATSVINPKTGKQIRIADVHQRIEKDGYTIIKNWDGIDGPMLNAQKRKNEALIAQFNRYTKEDFATNLQYWFAGRPNGIDQVYTQEKTISFSPNGELETYYVEGYRLSYNRFGNATWLITTRTPVIQEYGFNRKGKLVSFFSGTELITNRKRLAEVEVPDEYKALVGRNPKSFMAEAEQLIIEAGLAEAYEESSVSFRITPEMKEIKKQAEKDGTFMKAPNGADTNLTPEQWAMVRTKAFKAWFGDWEKDPENASKVVDENGEPMVVYHGTQRSPYKYNSETGKFEKKTKKELKIVPFGIFEAHGEGMFFSEDKDLAKRYARGRKGSTYISYIYECFLNIRHPDYINADDSYKTLNPDGTGWIGADNVLYQRGLRNGGRANTRARAIQLGYDGFILGNHSWRDVLEDIRQYVAFFPSQIKSATDNTGEFSNEDNDIRFRITPDQDKAYMDAVKAGDMETAQKMVIEAAKLAMPNTKVVDEEGNPRVVYHQTNAKVYVNRETGQNWDNLDWREKMEWDERDDWEDYWEEQDFNTFSRVNARTTNEFDGFFFAPKYDEYHEYGERTISAFVNIQNPASREDYDIDSRNSDAGRKERIRLQAAGFDGVIRMEGEEVDEYIAFEPSQIKSADPVTYDDEGNVIPLSQRFNPENEDIRFRIANENQAIFVSNAAKAVEGIKQEKATPEQWLKMIEKNGGLKAGEDKWMGLSDWLKASDKKTLTKAEVLDFINENMIVIEEQHYDINAEDDAERAHSEITEKLQDRFDHYEDEYYQEHDWDGETEDARAYAIEKLREEMGDTFPYTIELEYGNVYLTFPYEEEDDLVVWAQKTGVEYTPGVAPINETRLNYTTDGLENKHEIALTVPTIESWNVGDEIHFGDAGDGRAVAWIRFGETEVYDVVDRSQEIEKAKAEYLDYTDNLKEKYNIVGYGMGTLDEKASSEEKETYDAMFRRIKDLQKEHGSKISVNKKVLVIDEIQSKRHQEGRDSGYKVSKEKADAEMDKFMKRMHEKYDFSSSTPFAEVFNEEEMRELARLNMQQHRATFGTTSVPDAPFDKNWHELAMKRMLRFAAENGYDVIAWTKGEQQAERYGIGGKVDSISSTTTTYGGNPAKEIFIDFKNHAEEITIYVDANGNVVDHGEYEGRNLGEIIGKELAVKLLAEDTTLSEDGLLIGGEGMRGFYDKMLPAFMNKYGKKWGVKVEDIELPNLEEAGRVMHSVPVTEEMKASVMEGQVMFRMRGENESAKEFTDSIVKDFKDDYNAVAPIEIVDLNSKEDVARFFNIPAEDIADDDIQFIKNDVEKKDIWAAYHPNLKKIVIFVRDSLTDSKKGELALIHENIHAINGKYPEFLALGEYLWNRVEEGTKEHKYKTAIQKFYPEHKWHDELSAYVVSEHMQNGTLDELKYILDLEHTNILNKILNTSGYGKERKSDRAGFFRNVLRKRSSGKVGRTSEKKGGASELTAEERRIIGEYFPEFNKSEDVRMRVNSQGKELTEGQEEFFANSKAVDKDGNLLVLYHGTPRAGFTEFKSGWFTTSKEDAISYSGDRKGRLFDPNEKYEPETLTAGDFRLGYMTFDSEEDRAAFLGRFPYADEVMSEREYEDARMGAEDEEYDALTARRKEFAEVWNAYREYERERFVDTPIADLIANPEAYTEEDLMRAMLEYDSNASFDNLDDMSAEERKDALVSALQNANEETEGGISDIVVPTRVPRNGEGVKHNDLSNRTYEVYANVENPYEIDANGRGSEFGSGDIYKSVEEALADEQYDGIIIRNWRVGRTQQLGDVIVPKDGSQIKLTSNENPTESSDIQFRITEEGEDPDIRFSIRTKPAPKKIGTGYKVFYLKDGKLYPPMVANMGGVDTPVGVWLDAEEGTRAGVSKTGRPQVKQGGKGTQGGGGTLAYRPGWHLGEIPYALQFNRKDENGEKALFPANFVWAEVEYANDIDYQEEAMSYGYTAKGKFQHSLAGLPKLPTDGSYRYRTNPNPETDPWIITGAMKVKRLLTPSEVDQMVIDAEREPQKRQEGAVTDAQIEALNKELGLVEEEEEVSFRVTGTPTDEVVANGLQLTPAQTAEVAANIFAALPEESRKKITEGLNGNILGLKDAILQIPTSLATKENWNEEDIKLANAVRTVMQDAIDEQQATSRPLTTKEALWMLYDSTNTVKDLVDAASRAFVAHNLGFDQASMQRKKEVGDYVRFRNASQGVIDAATDMYNYETSLWTERLKESWLDMNQSVISLQKAMAEASGMPIEPWENLEFALNQLSSKSYADKKKYLRDFLIPMWDTVLDIVKHDHVSIQEIERYMMLKHGLERNKKFASRDAKEFYRAMYALVAERMKSQSHAQQVVALSEAKKKLADIDAQIAVASSSQLPRLNEARARALYDVQVADLVLRGDEKQNEKELQDYYDNIDNELDRKYWEFREKDYGGLTSMFVDSTPVQRSAYKSEEAYQQAVLAATTPRYDDVAAMESAAEREVALFENKVYMYKTLWDSVNAATKETLRHQYESGMITLEQYEAVRDMFEFYVPLRGFADNTADDMYSYYMNNSASGFAKPILGAKGRKTRAESPLGWIGTMAESAIQADNKNEAKMTLYYATLRRPDQNLLSITETWYEYTGQRDANGKKVFKAAYPPAVDHALTADELRQHMEDWEDDMKKKQSRGEAYKGSQKVDLKGSVVFQDVKEEKEHIIRVKVAGKDYSILINGNPRAAQAINGLLNPDANVTPVGEWVGKLRRGMSSLLTSFSPLFWVANYQRDLLSSFMRTSESEGWGEAFKYLANRRKAWRVASYIYKHEDGKLGNSYYENLYKEFAENGGVTGYTVLTTNKEYEKLLADYAKNVDKKVLNAIKNVWDKFMGFGEAIEQVSRFAAYITARESGKSIEESVNAAKEVSVNFNRKGSAKPISMDELDKLRTKSGKKLNAVQKGAAIILSAMPKGMKELYFFFNASVQALSSSTRLAKKSPGKAATWAGLYFGTSIAMAMINYLLSGDDDEEYLDLPDYLRHSTLLVKVSDDYYFKWSLPQEMRPFYAWADLLVSKAMGKMPHKNIGTEIALVAAQWLPVNPFEAEDPLLSLVPDYASPIAEAWMNKTSFGGRIYDDMKFKSEAQRENIPAYRRATEKTGKIYVDMAELLNDISGGDEVIKGSININPSLVEHLVEGYGGGIYDFAKMIIALPSMLISEDPVEIKKIPFVNKVVMSVDETNMYSHVNDAFWHYSGIADNAKRVENEYRQSDDPSRADAYREEEDWRIYMLYKQYEADFKDVKERLDNAVDKEEEDLLKQEQNVLREMFLNDIAKGEIPEVTFQIREDIKRIDKEVKAVMKPVMDANKERIEMRKAGNLDGMLKAIEKRDSLKKTPEYQRAEKLNRDIKAIKRQLDDLNEVARGAQRDSVIGELQQKYDALIQKMDRL